MNKALKYFLIISIALNAILTIQFFKKDKVDRTPPWHPFELNANLNLESVVEDGYRLAGMPCGQMQFTKSIGDTIIQYEVEVDCRNYDGFFADKMSYPEQIMIIEDSLTLWEMDQEPLGKTMEEKVAENKYYPWQLQEVKNCYQNIDWRIFRFKLGDSIDSLHVRSYVESRGGYILENTENWNTKEGGSFMVYYPENRLYFTCAISHSYQDNQVSENWEFEIINYIPALDQDAMLKEEEWQAKRDEYYENCFNQEIIYFDEE